MTFFLQINWSQLSRKKSHIPCYFYLSDRSTFLQVKRIFIKVHIVIKKFRCYIRNTGAYIPTSADFKNEQSKYARATLMLIWRKRVILNQTRSKCLANGRLLSGSETSVDTPPDGAQFKYYFRNHVFWLSLCFLKVNLQSANVFQCLIR